MRNLHIAATLAFLFTLASHGSKQSGQPMPDRFVIGRHTFFDFGPPNDYYELLFVAPSGTGSSVKRILLTPKVDICGSPHVDVDVRSLPESPAALLGTMNPCSISEKELKREFKRCKHCLVFSGANLTMQVTCGDQDRLIRSKVLDRDWFDPNSKIPEHTSGLTTLVSKLDSVLGHGVMDEPVFPTSDQKDKSIPDSVTTGVQEIAAGKYDRIFQGAPDKPSELYRDAQLQKSAPAVRLTRISPSPPVSFQLPQYRPIARLAHLQGDVGFSVEVDGAGKALHIFCTGPALLAGSVEEAIKGWTFSQGDSNRVFEGTIEFTLNCPEVSKPQ